MRVARLTGVKVIKHEERGDCMYTHHLGLETVGKAGPGNPLTQHLRLRDFAANSAECREEASTVTGTPGARTRIWGS